MNLPIVSILNTSKCRMVLSKIVYRSFNISTTWKV